MKNIVILAIALFTTISFAQKERTLTLNKDTNLIEVIYYHDTAEVSQTGTFTQEGKLQGNWVSYDTKGNKLVSAFYDNGKKVGKWIHWIDGEKKVVNYTDNVAALSSL
ncbi:MAG: nicotinic acid mononucleotide adenyltransferase [Algibacter sp.]|uniref:nicotinic acid mononucleotide adenyltransferase n=1 Tax=Algibacter sp. TaxID=1872428 RepID=UPI002618E266|nr:nicotinic acid mononucleotide adenyltransferase [Algibacter sp.]MDG1730185.1 nicotinic acid mononucleotide adenyltransferase [Algibacter sp.]MDG2179994.1 nicotinic acid mononucleotide adenyltransferase [Algibacter sp.]